MKRYNIRAGRAGYVISEHPDGLWVKFEDVAHLLPKPRMTDEEWFTKYGHEAHCNLMFAATTGTTEDRCDCKAAVMKVCRHCRQLPRPYPERCPASTEDTNFLCER